MIQVSPLDMQPLMPSLATEAFGSLQWDDSINFYGFGQRVGHGRISAEKFDEYLSVETIYFARDGGIELWFHDNDEKFYGHMIRVSLDAAMKIASTGLEG